MPITLICWAPFVVNEAYQLKILQKVYYICDPMMNKSKDFVYPRIPYWFH